MYAIKSLWKEFTCRSHITLVGLHVFLAALILVDRIIASFLQDYIFPFCKLSFILVWILSSVLHGHWAWYYLKRSRKKLWYKKKSLLLQYAISAVIGGAFYLYLLDFLSVDLTIIALGISILSSIVAAILFLRQLRRVLVYGVTLFVDVLIVYHLVKIHAEYESL